MSRIVNKFINIINKNHIYMVLVLLIMFIIPTNVLAANKDYSKFDWDKFYAANKNYWSSMCNMNEKGECDDDIIVYQKEFYTKMYKLLSYYQEKGVYIADDLIVTTAFYELLPNYAGNPVQEYKYQHFFSTSGETAKRSAIKIDDNYDVDIDYNGDTSKLEKEVESFNTESDTLKMLIKNAVAYYTYCYGSYGAPTVQTREDGSTQKVCPPGTTVTTIIKHNSLIPTKVERCAVNVSATSAASGNELGFMEYFPSRIAHDTLLGKIVSIFGAIVEDDYLTDCESRKDIYPDGTYYTYVDQTDKAEPHLSYTRYFDFLKNSRYFDNKPHLQHHFQTILEEAGVDCITSYTCSNSLEAKGLYENYEDKLEQARLHIIYGIIDILNMQGMSISYEGYGTINFSEAESQTAERSSYYWPIGSAEITEENGIKFAKGKPTKTLNDVDSYYGSRKNPITGEQEIHYGIDINTEEGVTTVVAAYSGTVVSIVDNCVSGDYTCNEGYGNTIIISHTNGDFTVYAHLASIDPQISLNTNVLTGELIGLAGSTGATTKSVLLYELRIGGNSVANAIDPIVATAAGHSYPPNDDDLRPSGFVASGYGARSPRAAGSNLTKAEFVGLLRDYCAKNPSRVGQEMCADPELVYDASYSADVNPELVIVRAVAEGNSPGKTKHNYWGIGCSNGHPEQCRSYVNLEEGIRGFANTVSKYENLTAMMAKYAYIGKFWYNPGSWSDGGCIYLPSIREFLSPQRQAETTAICSKPTSCIINVGGDCTNTIQEDQDAYASWQVSRNMGPKFHNIFGT